MNKDHSPMVAQWPVRIVILGLFLTILIGAASLPFLYPSTSLWYKFGLDKTFLQSGKVVGLLAATLLLNQLLLGSRPKLLTTFFSAKILLKAHQISGFLITALAVIHPLLILASEQFTLLTIEKKNWPEGLGALLFLTIVTTVLMATWRVRLGLSYPRWRLLHHSGALILPSLLGVHVLNVSDTYATGVPRLTVIAALFLYGLTWGWVQVLRHRQ
jgi:predicted ferric reductase